MRLRLTALTAVLALAVSLAACVGPIGRNFPSLKPGMDIKKDVTTKAEILKMFGDPTQIGIRDGDQTWAYYYWTKEGGKDGGLSKQLEITFSAEGLVKSYSFSSNFPEDMKTR